MHSIAFCMNWGDPARMSEHPENPRLRIRIVFGESGMIGPGKAELLERIDTAGSIAAAGRAMGMSYKRAWMLIETMNAMFREPVVESTRGGAQGGGARLTDTGHKVLAAYRAFEVEAARVGDRHLTEMQELLNDMSEKK